ncbi:MAG TPA: ATP-binding protein [Streptosporangiaceae bacterium]|nr:ATP-binding protein [Streptosporangiaceae bacterium]
MSGFDPDGWTPCVGETLACWDLRVESRAAAAPRALTRTTLRRWRIDDDEGAADIILMVDELVSNAVVHGHGPVRLRLSISGPRIRGEVTDASPALPEPGRPDHDSETGRGLLLVTALADEFGVMPGGYGKIVWFTHVLAAPREREQRRQA